MSGQTRRWRSLRSGQRSPSVRRRNPPRCPPIPPVARWIAARGRHAVQLAALPAPCPRTKVRRTACNTLSCPKVLPTSHKLSSRVEWDDEPSCLTETVICPHFDRYGSSTARRGAIGPSSCGSTLPPLYRRTHLCFGRLAGWSPTKSTPDPHTSTFPSQPSDKMNHIEQIDP